MSNRPSSDFIQRFDVRALIPSDANYFAPTAARQFAVQWPDGSDPVTQDDQEWVKDGRALRPSQCPCSDDHAVPPDGSTVVERDITVTYGPWRPVDSNPGRNADPNVAALHALSDTLLDLRDTFRPNVSPKQDGRRGGLEEAATWARNAADKIQRGDSHA